MYVVLTMFAYFVSRRWFFSTIVLFGFTAAILEQKCILPYLLWRLIWVIILFYSFDGIILICQSYEQLPDELECLKAPLQDYSAVSSTPHTPSQPCCWYAFLFIAHICHSFIFRWTVALVKRLLWSGFLVSLETDWCLPAPVRWIGTMMMSGASVMLLLMALRGACANTCDDQCTSCQNNIVFFVCSWLHFLLGDIYSL